ncbi:hypothetical protein [Ornithinibacillus sp. 179-J 7C1 HS]|uniref:hypothetical protein n=1 Tax=Ornithinibacillus sp. 179-J 7C1 HS TaxID=3142384 RepID=UPI0039A2A51A
MTILIYNCFNWVGYHYVNYFLDKGMVVKGVDKIDSDKKENLYMLVGRNSAFELVESYEEKKNKNSRVLIIGETNDDIKAERIIQIKTNEMRNKLEDAIVINAPILFGEWMDMTEEGISIRNRFVRFNSEDFLMDAVYITDFVKETYPLIMSTNIPSEITVYSKKIFLNEAVKLENSIYIRDYIPIEKNIKKVLAHYKRFKDLY